MLAQLLAQPADAKVITAEFNRKHEASLVEYLETLQSHTDDQNVRANREVELHQRKREFELVASEERDLRPMCFRFGL
jgi:hypothetical protein